MHHARWLRSQVLQSTSQSLPGKPTVHSRFFFTDQIARTTLAPFLVTRRHQWAVVIRVVAKAAKIAASTRPASVQQIER